MHCYYHQETEGVVQCAKCGITLCRECEENSLFRTDHGTGQAVCLRCSQQIAQEIVDSKTAWLKNRKTKLTICTPLILLGLLCWNGYTFLLFCIAGIIFSIGNPPPPQTQKEAMVDAILTAQHPGSSFLCTLLGYTFAAPFVLFSSIQGYRKTAAELEKDIANLEAVKAALQKQK